MRGLSIPFRDRAQEQAFLLGYGRVGVFIDVAAASVGLAASLLRLFMRVMLVPVKAAHPTGLPPGSGFVEAARAGMSLVTLLAYAIVGQQRYTFLRGPLSVLHRGAVALGLPLTVRPGLCRYCGLIWHQRLLVINSMCVLSRAPLTSYWIGGMLVSVLAVLVDVADPHSSCKHSYSCMLSSLADLAGSSFQDLLLPVARLCQPPVVAHAAMYAAGLIVPGVALSCLEYRARKLWLLCQEQHQQQVQQAAAAAAAQQQKPSSSVAPTTHTAQQHQQPPVQQPSQEQHHRQQEDVAAVQPQEPSASNSSAGAGVNNSPLPAPRNPLLYYSPNMTCVISVNYASLTSPALHSSASCTTARPAVALPHVVAAATAAATPLGAYGCRQALYRSPVECYMCSFKFKPPPGTGPDHLQQFKQQLRQHLEEELQSRFTAHAAAAAPAGKDDSSAASTRVPIGPLVTQCAAFPGCYQLVFQVMVPATAGPAAAGASSRRPEFDLQVYAHQLLQQWPGWQLLCAQAQLQQATGAAESAGTSQKALLFCAGAAKPDTRSPCAATADAAATAAPAVALQRYIQSACSLSTKAADHNSTLGTTPSGAVAAQLLLHSSIVQQLQQQGHEHVRVVVSKQPSGVTISDEVYTLQQQVVDKHDMLEQPCSVSNITAANPCTRAVVPYRRIDLGLDGIAASCSDSRRQCEVFTVVIVAGRHPHQRQADNEQLQHAAAQPHECGVLAQLPLLVLPVSAEQEFARLLGHMQQSGVDVACAEHLLLPVIRDLAAVLVNVPVYGGGSVVESVSGGLDALLGLMADGLMSWFKKYNMVECAGLLQSVVPQCESAVLGRSSKAGTAVTTQCGHVAAMTAVAGRTGGIAAAQCSGDSEGNVNRNTAWLGALAGAAVVDLSRSDPGTCSVGVGMDCGELQSEAVKDVCVSLQQHVHAALGLIYY